MSYNMWPTIPLSVGIVERFRSGIACLPVLSQTARAVGAAFVLNAHRGAHLCDLTLS